MPIQRTTIYFCLFWIWFLLASYDGPQFFCWKSQWIADPYPPSLRQSWFCRPLLHLCKPPLAQVEVSQPSPFFIWNCLLIWELNISLIILAAFLWIFSSSKITSFSSLLLYTSFQSSVANCLILYSVNVFITWVLHPWLIWSTLIYVRKQVTAMKMWLFRRRQQVCSHWKTSMGHLVS